MTDTKEPLALHVFHNGYDWWIGADVEDVREQIRELGITDPDEIDQDGWVQWDDSALLSITDVDEPGAPKETKTCAEWCADGRRGLLCSTEY